MKSSSIKIGARYRAKISGKSVIVEVLDEHPKGGWNVKNLSTNRTCRFSAPSRFLDPAPEKADNKAKEIANPETTRPKSKVGALVKAQLANDILDTIAHCVVVALAGTGKTFTLIVGIAFVFLFQSKKLWQQLIDNLGFEPVPSDEQMKVWQELSKSVKARTITYCAFNKVIVTEFGEKWGWLVDMLRQVGVTLQFATVNSLGHKAVSNHFGRLRVSTWHTRNMIEVVKGVDLREFEKHNRTLVNATDKLVGLCKLNLTGWTEEHGFDAHGITDDELDALVAHYDIEINGSLTEVYDLVRQVLAESLNVRQHREIDFDDQNWLPVVLDLPIDKSDVMLVDELQDLPRSKQIFTMRATRRYIGVGDVNQAIYGFAGADVDSIPRMISLLGVTQPLYLTQTRRCGKAIVEVANQTLRQCYAHREEEPLEFIAHESNPEGLVRSTTIEKYTEEVRDGDMVICRVNAPLVSQALRLIKDGRKAIIRGRDFGQALINFVKKMNATDVSDLIAKVDDWYQKEAQKEARKKNPSEAKLISLEDRKACVEAFCQDANTVDEVLERLNIVFAGKVCPNCNKSFNEEVERCPISGCKTETDSSTGWRVGPRLVTPKGVLFSSVHRAKGLESSRVYIIYKDAPIPHPMAKTKWQVGQEYNLHYVAQSRAIDELVFIS